jgi:thiol-disulfide isomerase/thioredoxin
MKKHVLPFLFLAAPALALAQAANYPNGSSVGNFTVTDTDGNTHSLHQITAQGKHVMLDFFFDTCGPCQVTQPYYNQLHETYGCNDHDLFVISINNGTDTDAEVIAFEATYGGPYVHSPAVSAQGGGGAVTSQFGVSAFPTYVLIGPDNIMKNNDIWPISSMQTFVNAFPAGSNIQPAACALVSVPERQAALSGRVFPSPTAGPVTLELSTVRSGHVTLDVLDAMGRVVRGMDLGFRGQGELRETLDLSGLSGGNYHIRLMHDGTPLSVHNVVLVQ